MVWPQEFLWMSCVSLIQSANITQVECPWTLVTDINERESCLLILSLLLQICSAAFLSACLTFDLVDDISPFIFELFLWFWCGSSHTFAGLWAIMTSCDPSRWLWYTTTLSCWIMLFDSFPVVFRARFLCSWVSVSLEHLEKVLLPSSFQVPLCCNMFQLL